MENNMNLYYDEEGDFLEITTGDISNCYFDNIGKGIFEIISKTTKKIQGIAIFNFKAKTKGPEQIKLSLPIKLRMSA